MAFRYICFPLEHGTYWNLDTPSSHLLCVSNDGTGSSIDAVIHAFQSAPHDATIVCILQCIENTRCDTPKQATLDKKNTDLYMNKEDLLGRVILDDHASCKFRVRCDPCCHYLQPVPRIVEASTHARLLYSPPIFAPDCLAPTPPPSIHHLPTFVDHL